MSDRLSFDESFKFISDAYPDLVAPFTHTAADLSAAWYNAHPTDGGKFTAKPVVDIPKGRLVASGRWALTQPDPAHALEGSASRTVFDASRNTIVTNATLEKGAVYGRYASANACAFCRMLATREPCYSTEFAAVRVIGRSGRPKGAQALGEKYHDRCVPAGTVVSGAAARGAYRRPYEGEMIVIDTASGQQLTITPNHPVLTDKGWIPAGLVNRGDNVIRCASGQARSVTVPDEHQQPALIEDVWSSLLVNGLARVPGSAEQFHGDGADSEVEIVGAYGLLRDRVNAAQEKPMFESILAGTSRRGGSNPAGHFQFGQLLFDVQAPDGLGVDADAVARRFDPAGLEFSVENTPTYTELGLNLLTGLGAQVEVDRVVESRRIRFTGYVYNLETSEGWYSASSLIVSNCHCVAVMVRPGATYTPPDYIQRWQQEYLDARKVAAEANKKAGVSGALTMKDIIHHWDAAIRNDQVKTPVKV